MKKLLLSILFMLFICSCFVVNASAEEWLWPVPSNKTIYQPYKPKTTATTGHSGIDISKTAYYIVYASKSGFVKTSNPYVCNHWSEGTSHNCASASLGDLGTLGNYIEIDHQDGTISRYGHLCYGFNNTNASKTIPIVNVGDYVTQGTPIGIVGSTGSSSGQHLHFTIKKNGSNFNTNPVNNSLITSNNPKYSNSDICSGGTINYIATASLYKEPGQTTPPDTEAPTISGLNVKDISGDSFTVECNLNDNIGVTRVWYVLYAPGGTYEFGDSASNGYYSKKLETKNYGGTGKYSFHLYAYDAAGNQVKGVQSEFNTKSPSNANLSINKGTYGKYSVGEAVTFSFSASDAITYTLVVEKNAQPYNEYKISGDSFTLYFDEVNAYSAYLKARNDIGETNSDWVVWYVESPPSNAYLSINKGMYGKYAIGEWVTFNFSASNSNSYTLVVEKNAQPYNEYQISGDSFTLYFDEVNAYSAYLKAKNDIGETTSDWVVWYVEKAPSNAILNLDKESYSTYVVNEKLKFTYSATDASRYTLMLEKSGEPYKEYNLDSNTFELSLNDVGDYSARIKATNDVGETYSNWVVWYIVFPDKCTPNNVIHLSDKTYAIYDIPLSWNSAEELCAKLGGKLAEIDNSSQNQYITSLLKGGTYWLGGTDKDVEGIWNWRSGKTFEYTNWQEGQPDNWNDIEDYLSISYNGKWNDCAIDNTITGFVCEFEPLKIDSTITLSDVCKFDVNIVGYKENCIVVLALYNNNRLAGLKILRISNEFNISENVSYSSKPDNAKVMVWNNLSELIPLCDAEVIPSNEFVTE